MQLPSGTSGPQLILSGQIHQNTAAPIPAAIYGTDAELQMHVQRTGTQAASRKMKRASAVSAQACSIKGGI